MSSPYIKLDDRSLEQWKVTELKQELKKRKLPTKGLKEELLKRLDEAVRGEMGNSSENEENDPDQSELPSEKEKATSDGKDIGNNMDENADAKPEHEIDDNQSSVEGKAEVSLGETKASTELEGGNDGHVADVETTVVVNETVETVKVEGNKDVMPPAKKDAKLELSDTKTQLHVAPSAGPDTEDSGNQDKEALHSADQMETDDTKDHQPDSSDQPLKHQVSEVAPDSGFKLTSASVSTKSVSIIEKNELKVDVITAHVNLELDVKHEMVQTLPDNTVPDVDESHPLGVEDPLDNKTDTEGPLDKKEDEETLPKNDVDEPLIDKVSVEATDGSNTEMVDGLQNMDMDDLVPEKLNLDRSSGDDSMEEDILESKVMDYKSGSSKIAGNMKEDDDVDVVGHDKPNETKPIGAGTNSALTSVKRKFNDKAAVGNSDPVKKARRWNAEGLKVSEQKNSTTVASTTPKGLSEHTKPFSGAAPSVNEEAPKERIVPPPSGPPTTALRIDNFLRPFTLKQVQELLGKTGTVADFWMDHIKTHCYVSYSSVEEAVATRDAVYNLQWPTNGGRLLAAEFVDPQEVKTRVEPPPPSPAKPTTIFPKNHAPPQASQRKNLPPPPPTPSPNPLLAGDRRLLREENPILAREHLNLPPPPPLPEKVEPPIVTLDDLFRKTRATPRIYYLPLSDEQVAAKKAQGKNVVNP